VAYSLSKSNSKTCAKATKPGQTLGLTPWPVTWPNPAKIGDPLTRFQHCYNYWPLVFSQWSPHLHRALQCSSARMHLQSPVLQPVLHAQGSNDSSLQLLAAWSTVVEIVNHSPPTVSRIRKQTRTPKMASLICWALAVLHQSIKCWWNVFNVRPFCVNSCLQV